jgi:hypothetical protein
MLIEIAEEIDKLHQDRIQFECELAGLAGESESFSPYPCPPQIPPTQGSGR